MAASFTATNSYSRTTYSFILDKNNLYVKQGTTTVATHSYANTDLAVRVNGSNFEVGSLSFNPVGSYFEKTVDYSGKNAGTIYDNSNTKIIGSTDTTDNGATKQTYNISLASCPVRLNHNTTTKVLSMICACDPDNCSALNSCYAQLN